MKTFAFLTALLLLAPATYGEPLVQDGAIVSKAVHLGNTDRVDWSKGNTQSISAGCGDIALSNMQDGGIYSLVVQGKSERPCSFHHKGLTIRVPVGMLYPIPMRDGATAFFAFNRIGDQVFVSSLMY